MILDSLTLEMSCFGSMKSSSATLCEGSGTSMSSSLIITACPSFELHSRSNVYTVHHTRRRFSISAGSVAGSYVMFRCRPSVRLSRSARPAYVYAVFFRFSACE